MIPVTAFASRPRKGVLGELSLQEHLNLGLAALCDSTPLELPVDGLGIPSFRDPIVVLHFDHCRYSATGGAGTDSLDRGSAGTCLAPSDETDAR